MTRRRHRDEDGAALVMALVFLTVAGILVAALLSFADTSFRTTVAVQDQRSTLYAADGAVEAAVNYYRTNLSSPTPCPPAGSVPSVNGVGGISVSCTAGVTFSGAPSNAPKLAVIARATGAEDGVTLVSGAVTAVRGGVYSNTTINVSGGTQLYAAAPDRVVTRGGCIGAGTVGPVTCEVATGSFDDGDDPGYAMVSSTAPAPIVTAPTCPATEPVVFPQGTYTSLAALETFMATCARRTYHFPAAGGIGSPGTYHFDFADDARAWTIPNGYTVVGGTFPAGVNGDAVAGRPAGGRCDDNAEGVQWLFGGASRVVVRGALELCAPWTSPASTTPRVAVYGVKTSEPVAAAPTPQTITVHPTTVTPPTTPFQPATGATKPNDASVAVATVAARTTASVTLGGFDVSSVPATSTINSAALVFRHAENESPVPTRGSPNFNNLELQATATSGVLQHTAQTSSCGPTPNCSRSLSTSSTMTDDPGGGVTLPVGFNVSSVLAGLSVTYKATSTGNTAYSSSLDGVSLVVTYTPVVPEVPRYRAQNGCIRVAPYVQPGDASGVIAPTDPCALVTTAGSNASMAVKGTIYAPNAALDIQLVQASYQVFGRGIIVRSLRSNVTSSSTCNTVPPPNDDGCYPFQLPSTVTTTGDVLFVATLDGRTRLRALVRFPSAADRPVVKAWSVVNEPA